MSMPGFTAETALYRSSEPYQMATAFNQADSVVHPAVGEIEPICYGECTLACTSNCPIIGGQIARNCFRRCLTSCAAMCPSIPTPF